MNIEQGDIVEVLNTSLLAEQYMIGERFRVLTITVDKQGKPEGVVFYRNGFNTYHLHVNQVALYAKGDKPIVEQQKKI